jgi:hypothetical protein
MLRARIREEQDILMGLMERRAQLLQENEALEVRSGNDRPLPAVHAEIIDGDIDEGEDAEEDLIDMTAEGGGPQGTEPARADIEANTEDVIPGVPVTPATPTKST